MILYNNSSDSSDSSDCSGSRDCSDSSDCSDGSKSSDSSDSSDSSESCDAKQSCNDKKFWRNIFIIMKKKKSWRRNRIIKKFSYEKKFDAKNVVMGNFSDEIFLL